jgi:hypothetical protein
MVTDSACHDIKHSTKVITVSHHAVPGKLRYQISNVLADGDSHYAYEPALGES